MARSKEELIARFGCVDCEPRKVGEQYMLDDRLWFNILRMGRKDNLCLAHVEARLGRALTIDDFAEHPINAGIRFGFKMGRLSAWGEPT